MGSNSMPGLGWLKQAILLMLLVSSAAMAVENVVSFSDESLRPRYQQLLEELRCPKCQNQNLADSNSAISQDLRAEVQRLLEQDLTDAEIKEYLKNRYSEFILYRPEVNRATWFLWAAPVLLVLLGGLIVLRLSRRKKVSDSEPVETNLRSDDQQQRLDKLLNRHTGESE
ncbi:cytochrome c-type biogenesis protein CcmH [Porticoccaceae bacterium]|jgi:cytochrome c-type biogenesis protein CcmH|nr:cytochrome c-type biogenesis protein CcmH [Porticoccaceae bacterium]MDG1494942.1 cytochrome c-type biogenesis protein CcmH [Porticoccaceae bacterium]|tara:strand:- start:421 stop:930 length:510 start_codon:yes stop_codon:yes gene_type:complete